MFQTISGFTNAAGTGDKLDLINNVTIAGNAGAAATGVTNLSGAITSGMEKAGAVLSLIILPLTIPVMIFGAAYCRDSGAIWQPNLLFLIGFSVFLLPILCLAGAYSIRASN